MKNLSLNEKKRLMAMINLFFDGNEYMGVEPQFTSSKSMLGVSKIDFALDDGEITIIFTLSRPGILIGKRGRTIDALTEYLSSDEKKVKISIIEFNPWSV